VNEKQLLAKTLEEKMLTAEMCVSILRVLLIALHSVVYLWFMDQAYTNNQLAFPILVVANVYRLSPISSSHIGTLKLYGAFILPL
jgi:hypothetical protein